MISGTGGGAAGGTGAAACASDTCNATARGAATGAIFGVLAGGADFAADLIGFAAAAGLPAGFVMAGFVTTGLETGFAAVFLAGAAATLAGLRAGGLGARLRAGAAVAAGRLFNVGLAAARAGLAADLLPEAGARRTDEEAALAFALDTFFFTSWHFNGCPRGLPTGPRPPRVAASTLTRATWKGRDGPRRRCIGV